MSSPQVLRVFVNEDGEWGNPLGVFLDGAAVPERRRQEVAAELGFSETVFVEDRAAGRLRIYTPTLELPFAGHPTVGAAWLLAREGSPVAALQTPAGEVAVRYAGAETFVAARPEWAPPFEYRRLETPGAVRELDAAAGARQRLRLGLDRRGGGDGAGALLRPRGRDRRGRGDRLGRDRPLRAAGAPARHPPGARLGPALFTGRRWTGRGRRRRTPGLISIACAGLGGLDGSRVARVLFASASRRGTHLQGSPPAT